jgi:hypothetical protein
MKRLVKVLRGPMVGAGGAVGVDAVVDAGLRVSRKLGLLKAVRMSLLRRLRRWKSADLRGLREWMLKRRRLRRVKIVDRVRVDESAVVGIVAGVSGVDATGAGVMLADEIRGRIRCGSGLLRVERGRLRRRMSLSI